MQASLRSNGEARQLRQVLDPVRPRQVEVERFLTRELEQALPLVREVTSWVLGSGGKRLRSSLVLLSSRVLGYAGERARGFAARVEKVAVRLPVGPAREGFVMASSLLVDWRS